MNKKIKDYYKPYLCWNVDDRTDEWYEFYEEELDELVKFVAKECASICITENVSILDVRILLESSGSKIQDLATISCGEQLSDRIKKHFGINDEN